MRLLWVLFFLSPSASAFVLLSGPAEAKLDVSLENPNINFYWDGSAPTGFTDLDSFHNGDFDGMSNEDAMEQIILLAFNTWNNVKGSYLHFDLQKDSSASIDPNDKKNSIVVQKDKNVTTVAYASPNIEGSTIIDCDVSINNNKSSAASMAHTITHELGHCLGLGHAHSNYGAIMGYSRSDNRVTLGADDIAGKLYLYPDLDERKKLHDFNCGTIGVPKSRHQSPAWFTYGVMLLPFLALFLG